MPHKGKIPAEEKVRLIERYLNGKIGFNEALRSAGIWCSTFQRWLSRYKTEGPAGFQPIERNRVYPAELKILAVRDYLAGGKSLTDICEKYGIRAEIQITNWIKVYNRHGEFRTFTGRSRKTMTQKATKDKRQAIAEECIAKGSNYGETAAKYNVSYQQVYIWVKKIQEQGSAGLDDHRGHRRQHEPQTEEEKLKAEVEQLKKANYRLRMENDFLKKLKEVEGRNR